MRKKLFLLYLCFFLISCSKYPKDVQKALELSAENRNELETVLEYFRDKGKISNKWKDEEKTYVFKY